MSQTVFGSNCSLNPRACKQGWPWLSFPLLDIKNGPLRKKLSRFFVRGSLNIGIHFRNFLEMTREIYRIKNLSLEQYRALKRKRKRIITNPRIQFNKTNDH